MITKKITLSTWKINHEVIYANEGEVNCRYIEVSFKDESENNISLSNRNVTFYAKKPDGTNIFNYCTIDTINNTATVELTSQVLSSPGIIECEFQIFDSNNVLLKVNGVRIVVSIEKGFSNAIESTSEFNVLTSAINEIEGFANSIGNLSNLTTTEKSTLTGAINEVNSKIIPIANGGTGATTALNALINLGITDVNETNFQANNYSSWVSQVLTYVDTNLQTRKLFIFHAGWNTIGYGSGLAFKTLDSGFKFLILFNENTNAGVKYYFKRPEDTNWNETSANRGVVVYNNSSGSTGTISLSPTISSFDYIEIYYKNSDNKKYIQKVPLESGTAETTLTGVTDNHWGTFIHSNSISITSSSITRGDMYQVNNTIDNNSNSIEVRNDAIYILKVVGYKY